MADEERRVATPPSNHIPPAPPFSGDERKIEVDVGPQQYTVPLEDDTNGDAQTDVEEPMTEFLGGWRLHMLTVALDSLMQSANKSSCAKLSTGYV